MSNIDAANALLTAIHFDRYAEIEARHAPDAVFKSFRGPTLRDSVSIADWQRTFLRDYADCNYTSLDYVESGNTVAVRATLQAKGYNWREFEQRVIEVLEFDGEGGPIKERRLYAMERDIELDKPTTAAMTNALEARGGSASATKSAAEALVQGLLGEDAEAARAVMADKVALVDSVFGNANGPDNVLAAVAAWPRPAFGYLRATNIIAGEKDALIELSVDPARPRTALWVRMSDGKIGVVEAYWMMREMGLAPEGQKRHVKQVILPI